MSIRGILSAAGIVGFILLFLVIHFYPTAPRSFLGWVALFLLGIPAWVIIESTGEFILKTSFFKSMPSWLRIITVIPVALVLMGLVFVITNFVYNTILAVGG